MNECRNEFEKWLKGGLGYTLKHDDVNYIMSFVDGLFNINDKLSSALKSEKNKNNKAQEYIRINIDQEYDEESYQGKWLTERIEDLSSILKGDDNNA